MQLGEFSVDCCDNPDLLRPTRHALPSTGYTALGRSRCTCTRTGNATCQRVIHCTRVPVWRMFALFERVPMRNTCTKYNARHCSTCHELCADTIVLRINVVCQLVHVQVFDASVMACGAWLLYAGIPVKLAVHACVLGACVACCDKDSRKERAREQWCTYARVLEETCACL